MIPFLALAAGDWLIYTLAAVLVLFAILLLLAVAWIITSQNKQAAGKKKDDGEAAKKEDAKKDGQTSTGLAPAFLSAMSQLRHRVSGRDYRYRVPWYLMMGPPDSGKTTLLTDSHLRFLLEEDGRGFAGDQSIGWKFYGDGIVLDTAGAWSMGAGAHDAANWKRLLRLLNRHRPQRPLDGIIITIASTDLVGPDALEQVPMLRSAALLHDRLRQVQQILGFRLPVYFVVTKCDHIAGFRNFSQELPPERLRDMFGWSSPYNLDTAFDPSWVDEAFVEVRSTIEQTQNEIFAQRDYTEARQEMFLFPGELQSLYAPLKGFLSRAMRSTAYRESFYFRGIYFTGEFQEQAQPTQSGVDILPPQPVALSWGAPETSIIPPIFEAWNGPEERIAFVYDLFVKKIFVERGIAHPISNYFYTRNRTTIALQVATAMMVVVLALGTTLNYMRLQSAKSKVTPLLGMIVHDLNTSTVNASGQIVSTSDPTDAGDLLQAMASLRTQSFRSVFLPASWLSPIDGSIRSAMVPAFRVLVLESFNNGLEHRAAQITNPEARPLPTVPAQSSPDGVVNFSVQALPEYQQLRAYVDQMQALEDNIALYESIRKRGGSAGVSAILDLENYISGKKISIDMEAPQNPYFDEALQQATWTPFVYQQSDIQHASQKMEQLTTLFFNAWIEHNPVLLSLQDLGGTLDQVNSQMLVTYEQLTTLQQAFHTTEIAFQSPELQWVAAQHFVPTGEVYALTVEPLHSSHYFQPYLQQWIPYSAETSFNKLTDNIADQQTTLTGPLTEVDDNSLAFTDNAEKVHIALDNLMNLPFVAKTSAQKVQDSPKQGMHVEWNNAILGEAIALPDTYNHYVQEDLQNAPASLRSAFERIASQRLAVAMEDEAVQAENIRPNTASGNNASLNQDILPAVQGFQSSADTLSQLLNTFYQLDMAGPYDRLRRVTSNQASSLLVQLNTTFDSEQPYTIPDVAYDNWRGDTTPTVAVLNVQTAEDMQTYLSLQRERVRSYNNAAAPLVRFLQMQHAELSPTARSAFNRWQKIGMELKYYDSKRPGNTVAQLETFLDTDMDKMSPSDLCVVNAKTAYKSQGSDYFLQVRSSIRLDLYKRCQVLSTFDVTREYGNLASIFNRRLAGRFPFAPASDAVIGMEADPQSIHDFYTAFDAYADLIQRALQQDASYGASGQAARAFLQQMQTSRPFFASMLGKPGQPSLPAIDFTPHFRVNQNREINGNQIMQWTLQVGQDTFQSDAPVRAGRWIYGQPITLTLRWAKNSPSIPFLNVARPGVDLAGQTLTYHFNDDWALLSIMADHSTPITDFDQLADPQPFTLVFQTDEDANGSHGATVNEKSSTSARVFLGMTITAPGKQDSLHNMDFPVTAPLLQTGTDTAQKTGGQL